MNDTATPTAQAGTYDDPIRLETEYGPLSVWFTASPSAVKLDTGYPRVHLDDPDEAPRVHASVRSPECADDADGDPPVERGYINGHRAYWPLNINGIAYQLDGYFELTADGWRPARDQGYYTRVKRLGWIGADARAVATFGADDPTDAARAVAYNKLEPFILAALAAMPDAVDAARERARIARRAHAMTLRAELATVMDELDTLAAKISR